MAFRSKYRHAAMYVSALLLTTSFATQWANAEQVDTGKNEESSKEILLDSGQSFTAPKGYSIQLETTGDSLTKTELNSEAALGAPHCIYAYKEKGAIQVQNDCPDGWRVKVVLRWAGDAGCKWIEPGTRSNVKFDPIATIDRLELC